MDRELWRGMIDRTGRTLHDREQGHRAGTHKFTPKVQSVVLPICTTVLWRQSSLPSEDWHRLGPSRMTDQQEEKPNQVFDGVLLTVFGRDGSQEDCPSSPLRLCVVASSGGCNVEFRDGNCGTGPKVAPLHRTEQCSAVDR